MATGTDDVEELDTGSTIFQSPYKCYEDEYLDTGESEEDCSKDEYLDTEESQDDYSKEEYLDTGESMEKEKVTPRERIRHPTARKRLNLTLDVEELGNETSGDSENDVVTECLPSTSTGKQRKKSSPKKVRYHPPSSSDDESRIPDHHKRQKGNTRIPRVQDLAKMICCTNMCISIVLLASVQTCRDSFLSKSFFEQRQWILEYLCQHSTVDPETNKYDYMFVIGTVVVCGKAWRWIHGITERRYFAIRKKFEGGLRKFQQPNSNRKEKRNSEVLESLAWLEYYAMTFGDKLPHMNDDVYHLPSCLSKKDVYKLLVDDFKETNRTPCSESYFYELWAKNYQKRIAIPKENRLAKCDFCTKVKFKLENHKMSRERRLRYLQKREKHLNLQSQERKKYYKHAEKARRYPHKYLCMIIDGMDQNKTDIPHFSRLAKSSSNMWNLRTHLTGVIIHGIMVLGFFDIMQWPHDSNLTMNIILLSLWQIRTRLPKTLYLQMDNCYRENKNKWMFALCCFLIEKKVFDKIKVNFLMVGHTHEDIDQLFSRFSNWLGKHSAVTLPKLMSGFQDCYSPSPVSIQLNRLYDIKAWIDNQNSGVNKMFGHSAPHTFKFTRDEHGKAVMVTKKWSSDKTWIGVDYEDGTPPYLLLNLPSGEPELLTPDFDTINVSRLRCSIAQVKQFMLYTEHQWWSQWLEDATTHFRDADEQQDSNESQTVPSRWFLDEIVTACSRRPPFTFRNDDEVELSDTPLSDLEDDFAEIPPVRLGKPYRARKQTVTDDQKELAVGDLCALDTEKYSDYWPQIGEIETIKADEDTFSIIWYKGARTTSWRPWMLRDGKHAKKWTEEMSKSDIVLNGIKLTNTGKLTQETLRNLDEIERKF